MIYCAPHTLTFDWMPTKKACLSQGTPEVHVAVNFASPIPGAVSVERERKGITCSCTSSPNNKDPAEASSFLEFNLPARLLLELMDINDPAPNFKYVECEQELRKLGIRGILDVYHISRKVLATFRDLRWYGAHHLHTYIEECLMPLIKPGGKESGRQEEGSVVIGTQDVEDEVICKWELDASLDVEVEEHSFTGLKKGKGQVLKEESMETIMVWPSDKEEEVEAASPSIAMLNDTGATSESSESLASS